MRLACHQARFLPRSSCSPGVVVAVDDAEDDGVVVAVEVGVVVAVVDAVDDGVVVAVEVAVLDAVEVAVVVAVVVAGVYT